MNDSNAKAGRVGIGCRLDPAMHSAAKTRARMLKRSMNNYVEWLIERDLASLGKAPTLTAPPTAVAACPEATDDEISRAAEPVARYKVKKRQ